MNSARKRVVIISPTYNEKGNIKRLCEVLLDDIFTQLTDTYDPHILIVDDSSPDGTGQEVLRLASDYKNLHLLTNPKKLGLGNAYIKGMLYALKKLDADIVFTFDADFQHDPTRIPPMLAKLEKGNDIVVGTRYIPGGSIPDTWGWHRKFLSVGGNQFIRIVMCNLSIHDWTGGYRAIRRNVIEAVLPEMNSDTFMGYTFQIGLLYKAIKKGFRVAEVPIHFVDRKYGESKLGAEYIKNILRYIFGVRIGEFAQSRILKFGIVGLIGTLVQLFAFSLLQPLPYNVAVLLSIELAIVSNFVWNNTWTFTDRKLKPQMIPLKFIQFNAASVGSILIQFVVAYTGKHLFGIITYGHLAGLPVNSGHIYLAVGIVIGLIWNYFAYNRFVWSTS